MKPITKAHSETSLNMAVAVDFGGIGSANPAELDEVKLHISAAVTGASTFVVTLRSKYGSQYDTKLFSQAMVGVQDVLWQPERPVKLNGADRITAAWTNDAGADVKAWGLLINVKA